jgi:hypothetical protein
LDWNYPPNPVSQRKIKTKYFGCVIVLAESEYDKYAFLPRGVVFFLPRRERLKAAIALP